MVGIPPITFIYTQNKECTADCDPPPHVKISVCLYVILLPYIDDILVLFMGMYGQRVSSVHVPHGMELYPVLHDTCFRCDIASPMFISIELYTPKGADYAPIMLEMEE